MKKLSLKERLIRYLRRQGDWVASGTLQRLAQEKGSYSPQNTGRRLRELVEDGVLEVEYRNPHNHAWYRYIAQKKVVSQFVPTENGVREIKREVTL